MNSNPLPTIVDELPGNRRAFDYIIVGGGTAGCVIADRLAENLPDASVLVIEGGESELDKEEILNLNGAADLWGSDQYDYCYRSIPQPYGNSNIIHSRAKMLGGCSSHNGAIAFAPLAYDSKRWQDLGAVNWTHAEMLRLMHKLRNNITPVDERHRSQVVKDWVQTCSQVFGVPTIDDFNREIEERGNLTQGCGFLSMSYTPENNHRSSASVAYIHPILRGEVKRPNLTILQNTWVSRILFHGATATGITATTKAGDVYSLTARREVVLCAGAIDTPRLMLLSGLGPRKQLATHGIPLVHDIPGVGENLQDHAESMYMWELNEEIPADQIAMGSEAVMVLRREEFNARGDDNGVMDTLFHMFTVPFDTYTKPMGYKTPQNAFCVIPYTPRPASVGRLWLKSGDPKEKPVLDQKYFSDREGYDKASNLFMLKMARKMAEAEPFKQHLKREIAPGAHIVSDEDLCEYGRKVHNTVYHPCGTAKMGNVQTDPMAVVDPSLNVRGVRHLRVADASVFPCMTSINPMVTVLAVGERAAELIIEAARKEIRPVL
ncbi:hypothetical protein FE257_004181 [Aspergillus nanangensis]|uniref:Glucose-methanol-choline oxidoreductase N-terminal domain-containing protein n=1 Tax=Aspergillus nanangensis TaxID=2582783 RepID=A0AAD4GVZ8_ASPNN|nr:hypothetical protein FE257_004181 [Aspergillus nanangensis]